MKWLISDTHFDHTNIIKYCDRPYGSVEAMNRSLIDNWNETVGEGDTVFFLGDLAFGHDPLSWLDFLNGHIILIRGSHDRFNAKESLVLHSGGIDVLLIHDPVHIPEDWRGWVIHGHKHNTVPLIDPTRKRVNVSVEAIGYRPISVSRIVAMIQQANSRSREFALPRPVYAKTRSVKKLVPLQRQEIIRWRH